MVAGRAHPECCLQEQHAVRPQFRTKNNLPVDRRHRCEGGWLINTSVDASGCGLLAAHYARASWRHLISGLVTVDGNLVAVALPDYRPQASNSSTRNTVHIQHTSQSYPSRRVTSRLGSSSTSSGIMLLQCDPKSARLAQPPEVSECFATTLRRSCRS